MQAIKDLISFIIFTLKQLNAFCTAVLIDAYTPANDDPLGVPGTHAIPAKGQTSGGLAVHDEWLHEIYEDMAEEREQICKDMAKEIGQIYETFKDKYTRRLWAVYELQKRVCETCYDDFMGYEWQKSCYRCRSKGE